MKGHLTNPRVLIVSPEITCFPKDMVGNQSPFVNVKTGGFNDVSATWIRMEIPETASFSRHLIQTD